MKIIRVLAVSDSVRGKLYYVWYIPYCLQDFNYFVYEFMNYRTLILFSVLVYNYDEVFCSILLLSRTSIEIRILEQNAIYKLSLMYKIRKQVAQTFSCSDFNF